MVLFVVFRTAPGATATVGTVCKPSWQVRDPGMNAELAGIRKNWTAAGTREFALLGVLQSVPFHEHSNYCPLATEEGRRQTPYSR